MAILQVTSTEFKKLVLVEKELVFLPLVGPAWGVHCLSIPVDSTSQGRKCRITHDLFPLPMFQVHPLISDRISLSRAPYFGWI